MQDMILAATADRMKIKRKIKGSVNMMRSLLTSEQACGPLRKRLLHEKQCTLHKKTICITANRLLTGLCHRTAVILLNSVRPV